MKRLATLIFAALLFAAPAAAADWTVPGDFATIQDALDDPGVVDGDRILVGPGAFDGAIVNKGVEIRGIGGSTIVGGPVHGSGLIQGFRLVSGADGATISHLRFTEDVDLTIMNGAAVNDVTVEHCRFENSIQAISNWIGSGWIISHNRIVDLRTRCGGGIGILVADWTAQPDGVKNNVISHNKIYGTLHVSEDDCGGYCGTGIVLYADFRGGAPGAIEISNNRIVKNRISLVSDNPGLVDVVAIELTDTRNDPNVVPYPVVFDNAIGFNDLRGTEWTMAFTPEDLEDCNYISRNLGKVKNRGHGEHPSVFGPGGH